MHDPHIPASAHGMCMCVMWGYVCVIVGVTCVHMPLSNTFNCVWRCLCPESCLRLCVSICVPVLYLCICCISEHLLSYCFFKWVCACDKRKTKDSQRKPDPTRIEQSVWCCFSDLVRCVNTYPVQSLATAVWGNMEPKTYFSHDGICQVDKPFHCNLRGCCVGCVKHPLHLCLPSLLYILARVASEILLVAILKTLEGDLEKIGTCLVWIFF